MAKDEFYIGWNDPMPDRNKKALRRLLIPVFLLIPVLAFILVFFMKPFNDHQFELGQIKEFTGIYQASPFPALLLDADQAPAGHASQALLVGYGKNGALGFMQAVEKEQGPLSGKKIKIQGTLIFGDGKTLIELTKKEQSFLEILADASVGSLSGTPQVLEAAGEILDPKCWFGVMKPGEGKVHKSCAIRCVSGGIPPVFRIKKDGKNTYYILKGLEGQEINQAVLPFIGEPVLVSGNTYTQHGWNILQIDPQGIQYQ